MERMQGRPTSATPDRMNNFDLVASRKLVLSVAAARHDDLIDFQRNAPPGQLELLEQIGDGTATGKNEGFSVDDDFHTNILPQLHIVLLQQMRAAALQLRKKAP